ncbi:hypothetical protein ACWD4N_21315, partial [Streptomyces sp. NPDC002586]
MREPPSTEEGGDMTDPNAIQPSALDQLPDRDPEETAEWQASLDAVAREAGPHRAAYLMRRGRDHGTAAHGDDHAGRPRPR